MIDNEITPEQPAQTQREPSQAETAAMIADTLASTPRKRKNWGKSLLHFRWKPTR